MRTAATIALACLLGGLLSLLVFNEGLTYDPAAWAVWAAELPHRTMGLGSGPSWKPFPVLVTAPFALVSWNFGGSAWLVIVRTCCLVTSVLLWRMASRTIDSENRPWSTEPAALTAGLVAATIPWLNPSWLQFALAGASEPVMLALLLCAVETHLAGYRKLTVAIGVAAGLIRPEVWLMLAIYGVWLLRKDGARVLPLLGVGVAVELGGWFGIPWLAGGDPMQSSHRARVYVDRVVDLDEFLHRVLTELPWPAWMLIALGIVATVRLRNSLLRVLTAAGLGWLVVEIVMTEAGFSGIGRYAVPGLIILCVTAGAGAGFVVSLLPNWRRAALAVAAVVVGLTFVAQWPALSYRVDKVEQIGRDGRAGLAAINRAGGATHLLKKCGPMGTNWVYTPVLSWRAHVSLGNIGHRDFAPAILLLRGTRSGKRQPVPPAETVKSELLATKYPWQVRMFEGKSSCATR
ncbi:MAG: hypothetical protein NTY57_05705 [Solirubrobacterales bacterium]|nr:hypothetical protein [Solirubrobacterales bacterium]